MDLFTVGHIDKHVEQFLVLFKSTTMENGFFSALRLLHSVYKVAQDAVVAF